MVVGDKWEMYIPYELAYGEAGRPPSIPAAACLIFTMEIMIRLIALDYGPFFSDNWNVMDFVIVVGCLLMIPLEGSVNLQAVRPFRLLLVFRMIKRARGIQVMISAILTALPALFNVFSMLFLNFFVFAILGMTLFGNVKYGGALNNNANFRDFGSSFLLLLRMVTGESWNYVMKETFLIVYPIRARARV